MADLHTIIAGPARARPTVDLRTAQICLRVAMRVRTRDEVLAELDEDRLADLYVDVVEVVEGGSRLRPEEKATHALESRRRQGLLSRVDGAGLVLSYPVTLRAASSGRGPRWARLRNGGAVALPMPAYRPRS